MKFEDAIIQCRASGLEGWELVEYAQKLVSREMKYSYSNSFDMPKKAFERGMGYCWQQSGALNIILKKLGFKSRLVHAFKNLFPDTVFEGALIKEHFSGHVWCQVEINGVEKEVCPGHGSNKPGIIHFRPVSKIKEWRLWISILSYLGSAVINTQRLKKFICLKAKQEARNNPDCCTCTKNSCPRLKKCDECCVFHYSKQGLPHCERK